MNNNIYLISDLVHMTCRQQKDAFSDLQPLAEKLFEMNPKFDSTSAEKTNEEDTENVVKSNKNDNVKEDENQEETKLKQDRPNCLWSLYFNMPDTSECDFSKWEIPENVFLCGGPDLDLDYDHAVDEVKYT